MSERSRHSDLVRDVHETVRGCCGRQVRRSEHSTAGRSRRLQRSPATSQHHRRLPQGSGHLHQTVCKLFRCVDPLPSARQHPSYGDCLEVKREYYQNSSVLDCVTQCSQSAAHLCEQFLQVKQIGLSHCDPYTVHRGGCLELYYCNMVEWFWWDSSLIFDANWFPSVL